MPRPAGREGGGQPRTALSLPVVFSATPAAGLRPRRRLGARYGEPRGSVGRVRRSGVTSSPSRHGPVHGSMLLQRVPAGMRDATAGARRSRVHLGMMPRDRISDGRPLDGLVVERADRSLASTCELCELSAGMLPYYPALGIVQCPRCGLVFSSVAVDP